MYKIFISVIVVIGLLSAFNDCGKPAGELVKLSDSHKIKVGVFNGNGAGAVSVIETIEALKIDTGILATEISPADILTSKIEEYDAVIFPGGSGSKELNSLGKLGRARIHKFIKEDGKGVIGICAGGYLLSNTPTYISLKIASAKNIDRKHYARGRGLVQFSPNEKGLEIFPELKNQSCFVQYYDGPVLQPIDSLNPKYTELATYVTDIHANKGIPTGVTPGKTFLYHEDIEKGKIFVIAGHPESTPGMRWMVPRMARFVTGSKLVSYNPKWIRPELNDSAIMFVSDLKKYEKENFWKLLNDTVEVQLEAMDNLYNIRSRPAVRWSIGLLRDTSPEVRKHAAYLLKQTEYSDALPDLKAALSIEADEAVKKQLQETIDFLENP